MLRRTLAALAVMLLVGSLSLIPRSHQPAWGAEGLVGAVGCSQTGGVFIGLEMMGADGYWPTADLQGYGGGVLSVWGNLNSNYWDIFKAALAKNPQTTDIWVEFCVKDRTDPNATAADLATGVSIVNEIRSLIPSATVHVSAMNEYAGIVCDLSGPSGPAVAKAVADHVVQQGLAVAGPVVGPLDASTVLPDGCHANDAGKLLQAQQLEAYFAGTTTPPTPPPPGTPPPPTPDPDSPFTDIAGSVFTEDIIWLAEQGITSGCNPPVNDHFCPDTEVTREQMATFLSRAIDLPATQVDLFLDDANSLHEAAINSIGVAEITLGCNPPTNDQYCPKAKVSRGQMASFLVRAYGLPETALDLFIDDAGSIYESDINSLARSGVTVGCNPPSNDQYCPGFTVTRGQMAAFLHRADQLKR